MNRRAWREWVNHVTHAYEELRARCARVFVGGLSMGTLLSLHLAAEHPEIPALALYAPAAKINNRLIYLTPVMKYFVATWKSSGASDLGDPAAETRCWSYGAYPVRAAHELLKLTYRVRSLLPRVTTPTLVLHASRGRHIRDEGACYVIRRIGARDKELVVLANSGHVLTVDQQWQAVAERTHAFFEAHGGATC